jgi:hypothetical protein
MAFSLTPGSRFRNRHRFRPLSSPIHTFSKILPPGETVDDITLYLEMLTLDNPDQMVDGLEHIAYTTRYWSFSDPSIFEERRTFQILFQFASESSVDPFFQSRALKILANVLDDRLPVYFSILADGGIVDLIVRTFSHRQRKVVLNVVKLAARFAVFPRYGQGLLNALTMKPVLALLGEYVGDVSVANHVHNLIGSFLSCDFEGMWDDFLEAVVMFIERASGERLLWIFWVLPRMICDVEAAERLLDNEVIVRFIVAHFDFENTVVLQAVLIVLGRFFEFTGRPIPNVDYTALLRMMEEGREDVEDVAIEAAIVIANGFGHPGMARSLFDAGAIELLVRAYEKSVFEGQVQIIRALTGAVRHLPRETFDALVVFEGIGIFIAALEIEDARTGALEALAVLAGIAASQTENPFVQQCHSNINIEVLNSLCASHHEEITEMATKFACSIGMDNGLAVTCTA